MHAGACGYRSKMGEMARYRCITGCDYDLCASCMASVLSRDSPSCAAIGAYLFVRVSGLRKIGSGFLGSEPGRIYATAAGKREVYVCFEYWVDLLEKLISQANRL